MRKIYIDCLVMDEETEIIFSVQRCLLSRGAKGYIITESKKGFCSGCPKMQECIVANELPELEALNG